MTCVVPIRGTGPLVGGRGQCYLFDKPVRVNVFYGSSPLRIRSAILLSFSTLSIETYGSFVAIILSNFQQVTLELGITQR